MMRKQVRVKLKDGLYMITGKNFCAGFTVKDGRVVTAAPILVHKLLRFEGTGEIEKIAVRVCEGGCK